jgi:hypothetical protein
VKRGVVVALGVLGIGVAGALAFVLLKPRSSAPPAQEFGSSDPSKPAIPVTIATGYNTVRYESKVVDLTHLEEGGWRYAGGLV